VLAERIDTAADEWPPHSTLDQPLRRDEAFQTLLDRVDQTLHTLSDRQLEALLYRGILAHPTNLTAKLMHVSPGTVKATLHQAARKVRAQVPVQLVEEWIDARG
jgi:DNA-directed RNA polymerase specialized sigma24 family protein